MPQEFDATFRQLVDDFPADWHDWLRKLVGLTGGVKLVEVDADLGTVGARADKLYSGDEELLHFEVQLKSERTFPDRGFLYNVLATHRHGRPVRTILILPRREANASTLTGVLRRTLSDGQVYIEFRYTVVRLWELPADGFLTGPLGTLPLAALTDDAEPRLAEVVARVHERLHAELPPERAARTETSAFVLLGLRYNEEVVEHLFEGVTEMEESSTYRLIMRKGGVVDLREAIISAGEAAFGAIPPEVESSLAMIKDNGRLKRMVVRIRTANGWDELLATP